MILTFPDEGDIRAKDLSYYLYYFSATYTVAVEKYGDISPASLFENLDYYVEDFRKILHETSSKSAYAVSLNFSKNLADKELVFDSISKNSPLTISGKGLVVAMALTVIISGGKFEGMGFKVEMNPIGEGIKILQEVFSEKPSPDPESNNTSKRHKKFT